MNILLLYNFTPGTTAWYLEQALRKYHNVKTCGTCSKGYSYHDIQLQGPSVRLDEIYRKLCSEWQADVFMMVDSACTFYLKGISRLPIPTVFYAIDTYSAFQSHKALGRLFDLVF